MTYNGFMSSPLIGNGLGNHISIFNEFREGIISKENNYVMLLNSNDANSLLLRIVSETGLAGLVLWFFFTFRFYVSRRSDDYYWIMSSGIFCLFIIRMIREGHYFAHGFFFFIWLYYFIYKHSSKNS